MTVRPACAEDQAVIASLTAPPSDLIYPERLQDVHVVLDDGKIVAVCGLEPIAALYLAFDPLVSPHRKVYAMRLIQESMGQAIKGRFSWAEAFLPPEIANKFGRRLERTFGFVRNFPSWTKRL